jgi:hypothetical protein
MDQTACKPGSVPPADADATVIPLDRPLRDGSRDQPGSLGPATVLPCSAETSQGARSLFGLAPGGACHAGPVAGPAVRSYRTLSPLPSRASARAGGLLSVALSLGSPPAGVARRLVAMEPGLSSPARKARERPPGRLIRADKCDLARLRAIGIAPRRPCRVQRTPVTVSTEARRRIAINRARVSPQASPSTRSGRQCRWKAATVWAVSAS